MRFTTLTRHQLATAALATALTLTAVPAALADDTVALKNALYGAGYDVSNVNRSMDKGTRAALRAFQTDQGLDVTGELDEATKSALGMVPVDIAAAQSAQTSEAGAMKANDTATPSDDGAGEDDAVEEDDDGGWSLF
ncbi:MULTISPECIES: peptidoglycan-binding domain-containing protein [Marinobacter]|jgi:peptidoglycan hydrolase-like protein with peptidoglycan-binding domain|uniref:peptidoglycan-binding domain-containing protein n=1 Tax=Marinobacter TaxID=2742 RepID=UPI00200527F1|nr:MULTISPECIES: peptidoglycan-binding domain-containing protein [Marinobacter]MCK7552277.1 peptidoglycan-binding protein [Marinobacter goseongensis]MDV3505151.1 peptidoglycan-binding domain-containing protein [Marinobacter sp. M-5]